MKNSHILSLIIICVVFLSCSEKNDYPKKYSRFEFSEGIVKMHSKSGVVTDPQKINEFAERIRSYFLDLENGPDNVYSFSDDINEFENYDLEITLFSETKGELNIKLANPGATQTIGFDLVKAGDHYVISLHDTIISMYYQENPRYQCKPRILSREPLPGGGEKVRYLRPLFIKKDKDEIWVSIISYMENSYFNGEQTAIAISGATNNLLSEEYLLSLSQTIEARVDTIAYKVSFIIFK